MKIPKIDRGDLRSIIVNHYGMVLMAMVGETMVSMTEKMVVDDKGAQCGSVVWLRMKEQYIKKIGFDVDEELFG